LAPVFGSKCEALRMVPRMPTNFPVPPVIGPETRFSAPFFDASVQPRLCDTMLERA